MKLDSLKPLLHHDGPLTTVCLDVTRGDESGGDREVRSRWNGLRRALEQAGAPPGTIAALEEAVLRPTHVPGPHGRYLVAADDAVLLDRVLAEPPARDEAFHDGAPLLAPAVAAADEAVRYLLVEIDRQGANLSWSGPDTPAGPAAVTQVEGGHDVLHKVSSGGGWSHRRLQTRVEDSWSATRTPSRRSWTGSWPTTGRSSCWSPVTCGRSRWCARRWGARSPRSWSRSPAGRGPTA